MLSEEFVSAICGPPLSSNTAIAKDVGIYCHTLSPTYSIKSTFKKSSTPVGCLAVSDSHVFAGQHEKAYVHVYSRIRGNQEAFVAFPERIRCLTLAGDVLIIGTTEGRVMLWETCTGRLVSTPPRHVQAVSCVMATPYHVLTGSDDSDVHVWSLAQLLELDSTAEHEPERTLSNHRAAITALSASPSASADTNICVSASKDKSCIIWNYQTGDALRTLLFPAFPLCLSLDPASRAICVGCEDSTLYLVELFADPPLLGPQAEDAATVTQVSSTFGASRPDAGPASCLAFSYDGTVLLTGHPKGQILRWDVVDANKTPVELANLNAAVTNLVFTPPLDSASARRTTRPANIVKPSQVGGTYVLTTQLEPAAHLGPPSRLDDMLNTPGFSHDTLVGAAAAFEQQSAVAAESDGSEAGQEMRKRIETLEELLDQYRTVQRQINKRRS